MNALRPKRHPQSIRALYCVSLSAILLIMSASLSGQTTDIQPGQSVTLDTYRDFSCRQRTSGLVSWIDGEGSAESRISPLVGCTVLQSGRTIKLQAGDGLWVQLDTHTGLDGPILVDGELPFAMGPRRAALSIRFVFLTQHWTRSHLRC